MDVVLGVDVGGTTTAAGAVTETGEVLIEDRRPTHDEALNVPELAELPLAAMLRERFGLPVFVDNDVNALALAEFFFGVGRGVSSLVLLAAGTGFGAGLVLDGRLIRGALGF